MKDISDYYVQLYESLLRDGAQAELDWFRKAYRKGVDEVHAKFCEDYAISESCGDPALVRDLGNGFMIEVCAMYPLTHPTECTVSLLCLGTWVTSHTVEVEAIPGVALFLERNANQLWRLSVEFDDARYGEVSA